MKFLVINESPNSTPAYFVLGRGFPDAEIIELCSLQELEQLDFSTSFNFVILVEPLGWGDALRIFSRLIPLVRSTPVIMVSNSGDLEIAVKGMKMGLDDVILGSKLDQLCELIKKQSTILRPSRVMQIDDLVQTAVERLPIGFWLLNTEGDVIYVNQEGLRIWGGIQQKGFALYQEYKGWWRETGEQLEAEQWPGYRSVKYGEVALAKEIEIENKDGIRRMLLHSSVPIKDRLGVITGVVVVQQDISDYVKIQKDLLENRQKLDMIMEYMGDIVVQTDEYGHILWASPSLKRIIGYDPEVIKGVNALEYLHPDDAEKILSIYAQLFKNISGTKLQHRFKHVDGHYVWLETVPSLILNDDGSIKYGIYNVRDISNRKLAEESLQDVNEKLRVLIEASPMAIMAANIDGVLIIWNPAAEKMFGIPAANVLGKPYSVFPVALSTSIQTMYQYVFQGKVIDDVEVPYKGPDNNQHYVAMSIAPLRNASGQIVGIMAIGLEITERKTAERILKKSNEELEERVGERTSELLKANIALQAEIRQREQITIALRESEQLYRSLIDLSPDSVILTDAFGRIILCSKKVIALHGFESTEELIGKNATIILPEENRQYIGSVINNVRDSGWLSNLETILIKKNGEKFAAELNITALKDEADQLKYLLVISRDITERKQFEMVLLQRNQQLEALRQIGLELTAELESDALLKSIVSYAVELVGGTFALVFIYKPELDLLESRMTVGEHELNEANVVFFECGEGLAGKVWEKRKTIVVDDYSCWEGRSEKFARYKIRATIGIPVLWKEDLLGVILVAKDKPQAFSQSEIDLLNLFGMQTAIALRNVNAIVEEKKQRQRADALARIAARVNARLNLVSVMSSVCEETAEALNSPFVTISLVNEQAKELEHVYSYGMTDSMKKDLHPFHLGWLKSKLDSSGGQSAVQLFFDEFYNNAEQPDHSNFSLTLAGFYFEKQLIGTLNIISLENPSHFSQDDLVFLQSLANQAAIAIANTRLLDQTLARTKELEAISNISSSLRRANGMDRILPILTAKIRELFLSDFCLIAVEHENDIIILGDSEQENLQFRAKYLRDVETPWKTSLREDVTIYTDEENPSWVEWLREIGAPLPVSEKSAIVLLRSYDTIIGFIIISYFNPHNFADFETRLLIAMADLAGNALQRASAMETLEKHFNVRTRDLRILYEVTWILSEKLELAEALEKVLERLMMIFQGESAAIHLFKKSPLDLSLIASLDVSEKWFQNASEVHLNGRFKEWLSEHTEPLLLSGKAAKSMVPFELLQGIYELYLGVPIISKGRRLGVVSIMGGSLEKLGVDELVLFSSVADQIGFAVERTEYQQQASQIAIVEARQKIARDLHDSVAQLLYSMNIMAEGYRRSVRRSKPEEIESWLDELSKVALRSLKEMRLLLYELRPFTLDQDGMVGALRKRLDAVEGRSGIKGQLVVDGEVFLKPWIQEELFFIAQEALNNSLKHGSATQVWVRINGTHEKFEMEIEDDGTGFDINSAGTRGGIGLASMRERTIKLGGDFELFSTPGGGTRVRLCLEAEHE